MEDNTKNIGFIAQLLSVCVIVGGCVYTLAQAESAADNATKQIEQFESRYTSTQAEFRELQKDVADIATQTAVLTEQASQAAEDSREIKAFLRSIDARLRASGQ